MSRLAWLLVVGVAAFAAGAWFSMGPARVQLPERMTTGYVLDEPRELPPFRMVDSSGEAFTPEDFQGDWSFLYFGYTWCPDICPASLSEMARIKTGLESRSVQAGDQYYLVSVDPSRDTPERLAEYVTYFDPDFRGLTGPVVDINQFTRSVGAIYEVPEDPEDENYLVGHSSTITLINPAGQIHAIFTSPHIAEQIADDFVTIIDQYSPSNP